MAVVATTTYLYVDTSLTQYFIQGSQLVDQGPWSSSAFYNPLDVVQIGVDQYVALQANSNQPPTSIVDANWSALVIVEEQGGSVINAGSDYYARFMADAAFNLAVYGTYLGTQAYNLANAAFTVGTEAYALAILGTNAQAAIAVGTDAYHLAESGTNIGWAAYLLAQIGTNTGTAALQAAASAQSTADSAFAIAVDGTNAAANANAYASIAWALAQMGTNTGTEALNQAATAQSTADSAFSIAVIGTNAAAYANAFADIAWSLAQMGTNTGTAAYNYAAQAYGVAESGSNTANDAYAIAVDGTNAVITEQGTRSQEDQFLQNQITALAVTFGSQTGTLVADFTYQIGTLNANLVTEQGTRSQEDQFLQNQISVIQSILGVSFQGTLNLFTAQVRYGKPDTTFTIIDGVLAGREESKFIWEDFDTYGTTTGTTPAGGFVDGSSWNGNGSIYMNNLVTGLTGTEWINLYNTGTITDTTLNSGTGWASTGTWSGSLYWYATVGTDTFMEYAVGTLSSTGSEVNGGGGWIGTAIIYTGSNRP
jgi:hypothetical protein